MKVYVDEMPKDCLDCPCISGCYYCNLLHDTVDFDCVPRNCPLQSLAEHDKELKDHIYDLSNKLLNIQLFLKDLRDSFHKGDETYEEIDKKLKELGGVDA